MRKIRDRTRTNRTALARLLVATLLAFGLGGAFAQDDPNPNGAGDAADPGRTVIELGQDDVVTAEEYQQEFERAMRSLAAQQGLPYTDETRELFDRFRADFLDQLATEEALLLEAEERGIEVSGEEVQAQIDQARERAGGEEAFGQALQEFGYESEDAFRESVREGLTAQRVIDEIRPTIEVTDEEVQSFYEQNQDQFGDRPLEEVRGAIEAQLQNERLAQQFADLQERHGIRTFPERVAVDEPAIARDDLEPNEPGQDGDSEGNFGDGGADGANDAPGAAPDGTSDAAPDTAPDGPSGAATEDPTGTNEEEGTDAPGAN